VRADGNLLTGHDNRRLRGREARLFFMLTRSVARAAVLSIVCGGFASADAQKQSHRLPYSPGKSITLSLPAGFDIDVAAHGIRRARFLAKSPDGRIFVTSMYSVEDNRRGAVIILDGWNEQTHTFARSARYLDHLHNPNSIAFWTDTKTGQSWLYVALTGKLVRYAYHAGDVAPAAAPQTLIHFPDYGLNYKYGGWHLTRTVAVAEVRNVPRIFVSVGSSCNYCQEREVARASILSIDPDGSNAKIIAQGVRNAVDLRFVPDADGGSLFATDMGDDHLGDKLPDDTFFRIDAAADHAVNYGWPKCYFAQGKPTFDSTALPSMDDPSFRAHADVPASSGEESVYGEQRGVTAAGTNLTAGGGHKQDSDPNAAFGHAPEPLKSCEAVPAAYAWFAAHSSPLGFAYFPKTDSRLRASFLVALHGASHPRIGSGYRVVQLVGPEHKPEDFITGFLTIENGKPIVHGRPCGLLRVGPDSFLLTDDYLGLVYFVHPK
jgi:glucose/arabinose dehydrogenase